MWPDRCWPHVWSRASGVWPNPQGLGVRQPALHIPDAVGCGLLGMRHVCNIEPLTMTARQSLVMTASAASPAVKFRQLQQRHARSQTGTRVQFLHPNSSPSCSTCYPARRTPIVPLPHSIIQNVLELSQPSSHPTRSTQLIPLCPDGPFFIFRRIWERVGRLHASLLDGCHSAPKGVMNVWWATALRRPCMCTQGYTLDRQ